jgi:hypothetical protein
VTCANKFSTTGIQHENYTHTHTHWCFNTIHNICNPLLVVVNPNRFVDGMSECWQGINNVIPEFQAAKCIRHRIVAKDNHYILCEHWK